jgi:hypothetical protein
MCMATEKRLQPTLLNTLDQLQHGGRALGVLLRGDVAPQKLELAVSLLRGELLSRPGRIQYRLG